MSKSSIHQPTADADIAEQEECSQEGAACPFLWCFADWRRGDGSYSCGRLRRCDRGERQHRLLVEQLPEAGFLITKNTPVEIEEADRGVFRSQARFKTLKQLLTVLLQLQQAGPGLVVVQTELLFNGVQVVAGELRLLCLDLREDIAGCVALGQPGGDLWLQGG